MRRIDLCELVISRRSLVPLWKHCAQASSLILQYCFAFWKEQTAARVMNTIYNCDIMEWFGAFFYTMSTFKLCGFTALCVFGNKKKNYRKISRTDRYNVAALFGAFLKQRVPSSFATSQHFWCLLKTNNCQNKEYNWLFRHCLIVWGLDGVSQ